MTRYVVPMRRAFVLLAAAAAACRSTPPLRTVDGEAILVEAERALAADDLAAARDLLVAHDEKQFAQPQQARYELTLARAQLGLGDPWAAYLTLRDFADDHPHSDLREQVIELEFQAGSALARSDAGFLFFWSDRRGARTCLEHLITRYPNCTQVPDALRLLGEMALADADFVGAEDRFRELLGRHPESEWAPLARFRFAMSIVGSLRGPDYDLEKMESATKELRVFLDRPPENRTFVTEAAAALERLLSWRAQRHLAIADFYRTVGNHAGEVLHLQIAAAPEFAQTDAAGTARERLGQLGEPMPPPRGGTP